MTRAHDVRDPDPRLAQFYGLVNDLDAWLRAKDGADVDRPTRQVWRCARCRQELAPPPRQQHKAGRSRAAAIRELLAQGLTTGDIRARLGVTGNEVRTVRSRLRARPAPPT